MCALLRGCVRGSRLKCQALFQTGNNFSSQSGRSTSSSFRDALRRVQLKAQLCTQPDFALSVNNILPLDYYPPSTSQSESSRESSPQQDVQDSYRPVGTSEFAGSLHNHPCIQLILQRAAAGSKPGARASADKAKIGLVVEGGGMRGIVSGSMLMALDHLGLRDSFDCVYGASAGAINLTYFLTGQHEGLNIYSEDLSGTRFINLGNLLRGGKAMDLDFLIDYVMHSIKPLDWHTVINSSLPLKVVASSLCTLRPVLLQNFDHKDDLVECLKASATVPQVAGEPRWVRGQRLVDAAIFEPVPVRTAIADGCTHVLVLCTRPATLHTTTWRKAVRGTVVRVVKRTVLNAPYMRAAWSSPHSHQLAQQDEELVETLAASPDDTLSKLGAYVLPVYPQGVGGCNPVTTNPVTLKKAEAEGWKAVATLFQGVDLAYEPDLNNEIPSYEHQQQAQHT